MSASCSFRGFFFQTFTYLWSFSSLFQAWKISTLNSMTLQTFPGSLRTVQQATLPPHMDGSRVYARLRQCAPHLGLIHASLGQSESKSQTVSRPVQPFCTAHCRMYLYFTMGPSSPFKTASSHGDLDPIWYYGSLVGQPKSSTQTASRSIHQFLQGWLTTVTDHRLTDRETMLLGR